MPYVNDWHNVPISNSSLLGVNCGKTAKTSPSLFLFTLLAMTMSLQAQTVMYTYYKMYFPLEIALDRESGPLNP